MQGGVRPDKVSVMTLPERIAHVDDWLLDRLFQPVADRLPGRLTALQLGLSCQLGALMLDGLSLVLPMLLFGASLANMIDSALIWCISLAFFLGMKRSAPLVRPGMLNPLRPLLRAMRLLSLAFLVYQLFRGMGAPGFIWLLTQMTTISQLLFTVGLYLVACQPRPPYQRMSTRSGPIIEGVWRAGGRINS
ncbi:hypothetical protein GOX01_00730 [Gluconobacter oxydans]|uniref:Uncharacterized protein n=1 Tax=Gluconobacter oxydans (strain 621H) TaxID=290633 RepID=Q5FTC8_GLUOX|nr:Hypothetical protein GOX0590 [Gluconobacter oxydans 621H]TCW28762.1 hypothetical protein EDC20_10273 [Gluconobacter oxydans]GEC59742.1 hypothetical protein GOX01_00730 [Gluconobacter oxydans]